MFLCRFLVFQSHVQVDLEITIVGVPHFYNLRGLTILHIGQIRVVRADLDMIAPVCCQTNENQQALKH
jgi:hypothetical protein